MRRTTLLRLLAFATCLPAAAAGGCAADNPTSLLILGNTAPGNGCSFSAAETGPFLLSAQMDLDFADSYTMVPTLMSGLLPPPAGAPPTQGTIILTGAHVEIVGVNSQDSLDVVAAMGPDFVTRDPGSCNGAIGPGDLGVCSVTVLDFGQVDALRDAVGADPVAIKAIVQVVGDSVTSNTYELQINLCRSSLTPGGCLVEVYAGPCMDVMDRLGDPVCFLGQDAAQICCNEGCFYEI